MVVSPYSHLPQDLAQFVSMKSLFVLHWSDALFPDNQIRVAFSTKREKEKDKEQK